MKIKVKLKENTIDRNLQKVKCMLLYDKLHLSDISSSQRIKNKSLYHMALRTSIKKQSCIELIRNLKVLIHDINHCDNPHTKQSLLNILDTYLKFNPYLGDELFENFKETIYEKTLS